MLSLKLYLTVLPPVLRALLSPRAIARNLKLTRLGKAYPPARSGPPVFLGDLQRVRADRRRR